MDDVAVSADPAVATADAATIHSDGTTDATPSPQEGQGESAQDTARRVADEQQREMDPSWKQPGDVEKTEQSEKGPTPSETTSAKTDDGKWFLDKYQGDVDRAAQGYKEAVKKLNEVQAENDRLRSQPPPPEQPAEPPQKAEEKEFLDYIAASPEVRHLDKKMVTLRAEHEQYQAAANTTAQAMDDIGAQIRELQQVLFESNDYEELATTRDKIRSLDRKWQGQQQRLEGLNAKLASITGEYNNADVTIRIAIKGLKSEFEHSKALDRYARVEQERQQKVQNVAVLDAIPAAAKKLNIPPEQMDDFKRHIIRAGNAFLSMRDEGGDPYIVEDWAAFFVQHGQEFKQMVDRLHRSQSASYATKKAADATQNAPNGQAAVAPSDKQPMTERDLDRWIKQQKL